MYTYGMRLGELLDQIRASYVDRLAPAAQEAAIEDGSAVVVEPALLDASGNRVCEGLLGLPMRVDVTMVRDGRAIASRRIETNALVDFSPFIFEWSSGLIVELSPFRWNECVLIVYGSSLNTGPFEEWFLHWFEERGEDKTELCEVVHFLSDPKEHGDHHEYSADFGSAPVESFEALLDACTAAGATRIRIGL